MIISVNHLEMTAKVELHRAGDVSHELMWWSLSEDTAHRYARKNNVGVSTVVVSLPIRKLNKDSHGYWRVEFLDNAPYIYGTGGILSIYGREIKEDEIIDWIDIQLSNVLSTSEQFVPVGIDTQVNFCIGQKWFQ